MPSRAGCDLRTTSASGEASGASSSSHLFISCSSHIPRHISHCSNTGQPASQPPSSLQTSSPLSTASHAMPTDGHIEATIQSIHPPLVPSTQTASGLPPSHVKNWAALPHYTKIMTLQPFVERSKLGFHRSAQIGCSGLRPSGA